MRQAIKDGLSAAHVHLRHPNPLPSNLGQLLAQFDTVLVPELNFEGQLANLVSGALGRPLTRLNRATGAPMQVDEILAEIRRLAQAKAA